MIIAAALQGYQSSKKKGGAGAIVAVALWLLAAYLWILAIVLAIQCNLSNSFAGKFFPLLGAIFFPEIYLIQWFVRKHVVKVPGYCRMYS